MSTTFNSLPVPEFAVLVRDEGTTRIITPQGDIDLWSVEQVSEKLRAAFAGPLETVVLDFGETTFLDSTGVAMVFKARKHAQNRHKRLVVLTGPAVEPVFEVCGLGRLLTAPARWDVPRHRPPENGTRSAPDVH